jgi:predicted nucleic acid-binding protein
MFAVQPAHRKKAKAASSLRTPKSIQMMRRRRTTNHGVVLGQVLRIAAITLANEATLLSRNRKDFEKIPDLNVENWLD